MNDPKISMTHQPIDDGLGKRPVVDLSKIPTDKNTPKCIGCGSYHGSVNAEINCMREEIKKLRSKATP